MSMFGGGGAPGSTDGGMPDMQRLMAQMMGVDPSQNLLGEGNDPTAGPANPFDMSGLANGFPAFPGAPARKSKVERYFPLIHAISVGLLLAFVVGWWEPSLRSTRWAGRALERGWAGRWAGLAGRKGMWRGVKDELMGGVEMLVCPLTLDGLGC